jgi:hypothetical protein
MSHDPQSPTDAADIEYYDHLDDDACQECGGDGGWNYCMEDTCCAIGGEEGCDDPGCWRVCPSCRGAQ